MGESCVRPFDSFVENSIGRDNFATFVGQQRKLDPLLSSKALQDFDVVIANAHHLNVGCCKFRTLFLQLNQLRTTVRSPVSRAIKDKRNGFIALEK